MKAIIDLGTNTFNLLVAEVKSNLIVKHYEVEVPVKIGKNGLQQNFVTNEAIERTFNTLTNFNNVIKKYKVDLVKGFATSAIRNASNGNWIIDEIKTRFNLNIEVIDGGKEAEYIYKGICSSINIHDENVLVMDIGGGSVEFIIGFNTQILWKHSFDIGAVRLFEKFLFSDPLEKNEIYRLRQYLENELLILNKAILKYEPSQLIGSAGSFDTIIDVLSKDFGINTTVLNINVNEVNLNNFKFLKDKVLKNNVSNRLAWNGMVDYRAEYFPIAVLLIDYVISKLNLNSFLCSKFALKEGALFD